MSNDYLDNYPDGLEEPSKNDLMAFDQLMSRAISFTNLWLDKDDTSKFIKWDSEWEKHLQHRQRLINVEGRVEALPWNIYNRLGLKWCAGYGPSQGNLGSCMLFGHTNSLNASNLSNAIRLNQNPPEVNASYAYAVSRGNGTPRWGSGANLTNMSRWSAELGNHLVSDVGCYDTRGSALGRVNQASNRNALKHQSIIIPLASPSFDLVYQVCSAGYGIAMGTPRYPTAGRVGSSGLCQPSAWKNGNHAMAFVAAIDEFIYLLNSHGNRYAGDKYHQGSQPGVYLNRTDFNILANNGFRFGAWYANIGEMAQPK